MSVSICDKDYEWREFLGNVGSHDFTHSFDFHRISMARGEGEPLAFVAQDDGGAPVAMWPVLKRGIDNGNLFDFTSVYGYAGPLVAAGADSRAALAEILDAMRRYGAVSLFSRMHPLFSDRLDSDFRGTALGDVVVIDVGTDPNVVNSYRGSHRREIVNARAKGVAVSVESGASAVADFHAIYTQAMSKLDAEDYYFFDQDYLGRIAESSDFKALFLFATYEGKKIAASMFIVTGTIMQYYLSGTISEFRHLVPSKVIIAEAHARAMKMGVTQIILGGGVGSRRDALFAFKKGFSPQLFPFHVVRHIFDEECYSALCAARGVSREGVHFFPAYRTVIQEVDAC
ncbi:MAG: peptidoglycan bridge formation glycyltransferase FemA/FemB family protein [Sphingopyxis granuli]|uniref:peptidoglycan bridge formation glycyltransferase FemA/FemB family protein n=1 Tax=Sphingopyxis granuli TaxID=267128 RepID=UPI003C783938